MITAKPAGVIARASNPWPHREMKPLDHAEVAGDLLSIRDLTVEFRTLAGRTQAVDRLSLRIRPGGTVALVGESGSGKSVTPGDHGHPAAHRAHHRAARSCSRRSGHDERPSTSPSCRPTAGGCAAIRGGRISIIFQEPMTSLSPLHTIGDQIGEALVAAPARSTARRSSASAPIDMLRLVGFPRPGASARRSYPFELSGGLRQRAMIAMALVCRPALLIADEPTTALDVTIQAQILRLIKDLQAELGMAVLMITHDLGVVANIADEVVVMYRGKVMESGHARRHLRAARASLSQGAAARRAALRHEARRAAGADPRDRRPATRPLMAEGDAVAGRRAGAAARSARPHQELRHAQAAELLSAAGSAR